MFTKIEIPVNPDQNTGEALPGFDRTDVLESLEDLFAQLGWHDGVGESAPGVGDGGQEEIHSLNWLTSQDANVTYNDGSSITTSYTQPSYAADGYTEQLVWDLQAGTCEDPSFTDQASCEAEIATFGSADSGSYYYSEPITIDTNPSGLVWHSSFPIGSSWNSTNNTCAYPITDYDITGTANSGWCEDQVSTDSTTCGQHAKPGGVGYYQWYAGYNTLATCEAAADHQDSGGNVEFYHVWNATTSTCSGGPATTEHGCINTQTTIPACVSSSGDIQAGITSQVTCEVPINPFKVVIIRRGYQNNMVKSIFVLKDETHNNSATGWANGDLLTIPPEKQTYHRYNIYSKLNPSSDMVNGDPYFGMGVQSGSSSEFHPITLPAGGPGEVKFSVNVKKFGNGPNKFWGMGKPANHPNYNANHMENFPNNTDALLGEHQAILQIANDPSKKYGKTQYKFYAVTTPSASGVHWMYLMCGINFNYTTVDEGYHYKKFTGRQMIDHQGRESSTTYDHVAEPAGAPLIIQYIPADTNAIPMSLVAYQSGEDPDFVIFNFRQVEGGVVKQTVSVSLLKGTPYVDANNGKWGETADIPLDFDKQWLGGFRTWMGRYDERVYHTTILGCSNYNLKDMSYYNKNYKSTYEANWAPEGNYLTNWLGQLNTSTQDYSAATYTNIGNGWDQNDNKATSYWMYPPKSRWQDITLDESQDPEQSVLWRDKPVLKEVLTGHGLLPWSFLNNPYTDPSDAYLIPIESNISSTFAKQGDIIDSLTGHTWDSVNGECKDINGVVVTGSPFATNEVGCEVSERYEIMVAGSDVVIDNFYKRKATEPNTISRIVADCARII